MNATILGIPYEYANETEDIIFFEVQGIPTIENVNDIVASVLSADSADYHI